MTERISDLKTKCSASESTLDSNTCNKAMGILKHKYWTLKELRISVSQKIKSSERNKARPTCSYERQPQQWHHIRSVKVWCF